LIGGDTEGCSGGDGTEWLEFTRGQETISDRDFVNEAIERAVDGTGAVKVGADGEGTAIAGASISGALDVDLIIEYEAEGVGDWIEGDADVVPVSIRNRESGNDRARAKMYSEVPEVGGVSVVSGSSEE